MLVFGFLKFDSVTIILIIAGAFTSIIINVTSFNVIFKKGLKEHIILQLVFNAPLLVLFPAIHYLYSNAFNIFIGLKVFASFFVLHVIKRNLNKSGSDYYNLYRYGLNAVIINGFLTIILSSNHILASKVFTIEISNNIILAWLASMPLLYLSTISEKVFFNSFDFRKNIAKWIKLNISFSILFILILLSIVIFFNQYLPKSVTHAYLLKYLYFTVPTLFLYSIINPPLNVVIFRRLDYDSQVLITISLTVLVLIFFLFGILTLNGFLKVNDTGLLLFTNFLIIAALIVKGIVIFIKSSLLKVPMWVE